jgi:hypothetical protein
VTDTAAKRGRIVSFDDKNVFSRGSQCANGGLTTTCYLFHFVSSAPNRFIVRAKLTRARKSRGDIYP